MKITFILLLLLTIVVSGCARAVDFDADLNDIKNNGQSSVIPEQNEEADSSPSAGKEQDEQIVLPLFRTNDNMYERTGNRVSGGGYIAEYEGMFYFANQDDANRLYRMKPNFEGKVKLSDNVNDTSWLDIQFVDKKLFYFQSKKIETDETLNWQRTLYSYDLVSGIETKVLDVDFSVYKYVVDGEWIYFSSMDEMELYKSRLDGSEVQLLQEPYGDPYSRRLDSLQIVDGRLFFSDAERIFSFGIDYLKPGKLWDDPETPLPAGTTCPYVFLVYEKYLFYIDSVTSEFCRFNRSDMGIISSYNGGNDEGNTSNPNMTVLGKGISHFTISEGVIYYSTLEYKLYKMDLDGSNVEFIADGYAPSIVGNYLFYINKDVEMICLPK